MITLCIMTLAVAPVDKLPITGLGPARVESNLCVYHYRVSTVSPRCQTFVDQALGYYASYVWMEAARNFETALIHDPECAFAWLGLHRSLEKWSKPRTPKSEAILALAGSLVHPALPSRYTKSPRDHALEQAKALMSKASHRESLLITAKLQEKGLWPNTPDAERKRKAIATLDELLTLYDDDQEGWFARAQIAEGSNAAVPFYKALLRINPLHPAANHELVHHYENIKRPALGWQYAEKYMESSPGIPHAWHMQAHLAMRIGKWQQTTDWSWRAIELERAYHAALNVKPAEDHQYSHHLETLTRSLVHDGRFTEAKIIRAEAERNKYAYRPEWIRMAITLEDWKDAETLTAELRKSDKQAGAYYAALIALARGDLTQAKAEFDALQGGKPAKKEEKKPDLRQCEIQGRIACISGDGENGLKLLKQAVERTKDDYQHHAWGNGATLMEAWGEAALDCGNAAEADEAFQEALAHDAGSVRGALGMWALCTRLGRTAEAERYLALAKRCWSRAEVRDFERLKSQFARKAQNVSLGGISDD